MATHLELSTLMYSFLHRSLLSLGLNLGKLDSRPMPVANPVPGWIYDLSQQLLRNRAIQQYHSTPYSVGICFLLMQSIELRCVASPSSADRNLCGCTRQSGSPTHSQPLVCYRTKTTRWEWIHTYRHICKNNHSPAQLIHHHVQILE